MEKNTTYLYLGFFLLVIIPHTLSQPYIMTAPKVDAESRVINAETIYHFQIDRQFQQSNAQLPWATINMNAADKIVMNFPSQYIFSQSYSCSSYIVSNIGPRFCNNLCEKSNSGHQLQINNCFVGFSSPVRTIKVSITNLKNPSTVLTSGYYSVIVGSETSQTVPVLTFTPGSLNCIITFQSPSTINTTGNMVIQVTPSHQIPISGKVRVKFNALSWTGDFANQPYGLIDGGCNYSCSANNGNTLILSQLFLATTQSKFSFKILNIISPPSPATTDKITITTTNGINDIDTCSVSVTGLTAKQLISTQLVPLNPIVNTQNVQLNFTMTFSDKVITNNNTFSFIFPQGSSFSPSVTVTSVAGTVTPTITQQNNHVNVLVNFINVRQFNSGDSIYIRLSSFNIPVSTIPISIQLNVLKTGSIVQTGNVILLPTPSTISFTVSMAPTVVSTPSAYKFQILSLPDTISATGYLTIKFPNLLLVNTQTQCVTTFQGVNTEPSTMECSSSNNIVTIKKIDQIISKNTALKITLVGITNPPSVSTIKDFEIKSYYNSDSSSLVSKGIGGDVIPTPNTLNSADASIESSDPTVKKSGVTYTIKFKNIGFIPIGGKIIVILPPQIQAINQDILNIKFCDNGANLQFDCSATLVVGHRIRIDFSNYSLTASFSTGSDITLRILQSLVNPPSTKRVSAFTIETYDSSSRIIDQLTSGLYVQMTYPASFALLQIQPLVKKNSEITDYKFIFNQLSTIEAGGYFVVTFPITIIPQSSVDVISSSGASLLFSKPSPQTLNITLPFISSITNYQLTIKSIKNSPSLKQSNIFNIKTYVNDGQSVYSENIIKTITNTIPASFQNAISYSFDPKYYGAPTSLTINFLPTFYSIKKVEIILADMLLKSLSCTTSSFSGVTSPQCQINSNVINIQGIFLLSSIRVVITGFESPKQPSIASTTITTYDNDDFKIDTSQSIQYATVCDMPCKICQSGNPKLCLSCYQDTQITYLQYFDVTTSNCLHICNQGFAQIQTPLKKCQKCSNNCKTCSQSISNCTSCDISSTNKYLYHDTLSSSCRNACPQFFYGSDDNLCQPCVGFCKTCLSQTKCLSCVDQYVYYSTNNSCLSSCPLEISVESGSICIPCSLNCKTCQTTASNCVTCSQNGARYNGKCVTSCPDNTMVIFSYQCVKCNDPCQTCTQTRDKCLSCLNGNKHLLYNNQCVEKCPVQYYSRGNNPGQCFSCAAQTNLHCRYCLYQSNKVICSNTCDQNYVYYKANFSCISLSQIPSGFLNISNIVQKCEDKCQTCADETTKCTSCNGNFNLFERNCITNCLPGSVALNNICQPCDSDTYFCASCSNSKTHCNSCLPTYYLNGIQCTQTCPSTTYKNDTSKKCENCQSNCATCDSITHCISCVQTAYLFQNTCKTYCPQGYTELANNCTLCKEGCATCQGSITNCKTCSMNYYFVQSSSTCVSTCPTGLYPYATNMTCTGCLGLCKTCASIPTNCSSCHTGGLLWNQCYSICPTSYYLHEGNCISCPKECSSCTSAFICQSCLPGYFFHLSRCTLNCPQTAPVLRSDGTCGNCSTSSCNKCTTTDYCYLCQGNLLVLFDKCVDSCPTNYESNTTFCILTKQAKSLADSLKQNGVFPLPFSIGAVGIIVVCLFSKFIFQSTYFSGSIYALIGIIEPIVHGYFIYLLWTLMNTPTLIVFLSIGALACLYLVNIISSIVVNIIFFKDLRFKEWYNTSKGKTSYIIFTILSIIFSFKVLHIIFSKLFSLSIFKAKLQHPSRLFCLNLMTFLALSHSVWAIIMAAFNLYENNNIATMLFFQSIDLIIISTFQIILGISTMRKDQNFFDEFDDPMLGKKVQVDSDSLNTFIDPSETNNKKLNVQRYKVKKISQSIDDSVVDGQMFEQSEGGLGNIKSKYKNINKINQKKQQQYQQLSQRSNIQSNGDPSSRLIPINSKQIIKQKNSLKQPKVNYQQISMQFKTDQQGNNDNLIKTQGSEQSQFQRLDTYEKLIKEQSNIRVKGRNNTKNSQKQKGNNVKNIKKQEYDNITPSKLNDLDNNKILRIEQGGSSQLLRSVQQSLDVDVIHQSPLQPGSSTKLMKNTNSLKRMKSNPTQNTSPKLRKRTLQQDVQQFQWEQQDNNNIISPKKKIVNKFQLINDDIKDISGLSQQGRQNMLRLKYQMQNRKIDENEDQYQKQQSNFKKKKLTNQEDIQKNTDMKKSLKDKYLEELQKNQSNNMQKYQKNLNFEQTSNIFKDDEQLDQSNHFENSGNSQLELIRQGYPPIKHNRVDTIFNSQRIGTMDNQGNTFLKNSQTMDKSIQESQDQINNYPAYIKHNKIFQDIKSYSSTQPIYYFDKNNGKNKTSGIDQIQKQVQQQFNKVDQLSKQLLKYNNKQSNRSSFSAGNRNIPFLRPIQTHGSKTQGNQTVDSNREEYLFRRSLERIPQKINPNDSGADIQKYPRHSSVKRPKITQKRVRNKYLQKIYLGKNFDKK